MTVFGLLFALILTAAFAGRQRQLRRQTEHALRAAHERAHWRDRKMQTILDNAPIVFSAIDAQGIFRISEGKGLEKLGRKNNQSIGVSIYEMHNQNPLILDAVRRAMQGERVATSFELRDISYDLFIGPELDSAGRVVGASMLSVDVSERKRAEAERAQLLIRAQAAVETSKLKSEFVATMSHEIRTPLNGVLGMTSLLLDTELSAPQREYAEAIRHSGTGLLTVINDILDFSKIEAGKLDFEAILFNLPELIQHVAKGFSYSAALKGLDLQAEIPPSAHPWVIGDPGRVRQVLNNLIGNAIKFTERGQVRVSLTDEPGAESGGRPSFRLEVRDTGIGISPEAQGHMFVAFSQAEASMSRRFGGTGLGLSIAKKLVEKMGGQLGLESQAGVGTTFWVNLSLDAGQMPIVAAVAEPSFAAAPARASSTEEAPLILVAEDHQINQKIAVRMLEKMGYRAHVVADGLEAIAALQKTRYRLVLMDCQMPHLDGLEATRRIRALPDGLNHDVPILAMTANAMKGDRERCLAAGMDDYVSKPVAYRDLQMVVVRWLARSNPRSHQSAAG